MRNSEPCDLQLLEIDESDDDDWPSLIGSSNESRDSEAEFGANSISDDDEWDAVDDVTGENLGLGLLRVLLLPILLPPRLNMQVVWKSSCSLKQGTRLRGICQQMEVILYVT